MTKIYNNENKETKKLNQSEHIIEFDKIKELWKSHALTEAAKAKIESITPCLNELELRVLQRQTSEAKQIIEKFGTPPLPSLTDIPNIMDTAEKEGCLTPIQLETMETMLSAVKRLKDYLNRCKNYDISLAYYEENLDSCDDIRDAIHHQIRNEKVDDYATSLLSSIRKELAALDTKIREKAEQFIRANKNYLAESFTTIRNGYICIPVKKEHHHKVNGVVMDKSSSGNTIFVTPSSVYKHYETLQMLRIDEENEEMRIRYTLTSMILDAASILTSNIATLEMLDFAFSKAKFSLEYNGTEPLINTKRRIHLLDARHPLMDKNICVPLCFDIGNDIKGIIITGPNTGGKTVTLKTVALCCIMAQCGLQVPCKEANVCMNANYLCDIGDGQNLSENLSTFSAHLKNILQILDSAGSESLVIMDELGSGTDPTEGMGIAIAVIEELKKKNALFLITTHYPEIKQYAKEETSILNARMDFDKENLKPLYKLIIGESGESCAFSIAKRLGMSESMLQRAAMAAYGENYHKHLPSFDSENQENMKKKKSVYVPSIQKEKKKETFSFQKRASTFHLGDSVMVYPDKKIGIVCETANEKGFLRIQLKDKKIRINHKRIKLHVAATELYPDDYDFSIIFDTVENRKLRHQMERKYVEDVLTEEE